MRYVIRAVLKTDSRELPKLMTDWSSCVRHAYSLFREGKSFRRVQFAARERYPMLNGAHILTAAKHAHRQHKRTIDQEPIVFGGKALYVRFCAGEISLQEWQTIRDGVIYIRGSKDKPGNTVLNVARGEAGWQLQAVIGNTGFANEDTRTFPLSLPDKYTVTLENLLASQASYGVRVRRQGVGRYLVTLDANPDQTRDFTVKNF